MRNLFFLLVFIFSSCVNKKGNLAKTIVDNDSIVKMFMKSAPPYLNLKGGSSEALLFGFSKASTNEDTSWTLLISKSENTLQCNFHEMLPYSEIRMSENLNGFSKTLYYNVVSFELSKQKLDSVISPLEIDKYVSSGDEVYLGCLHCPRYYFYYNSRLIVSNKGNKNFLIRVENILKDLVVDKLFQNKNFR